MIGHCSAVNVYKEFYGQKGVLLTYTEYLKKGQIFIVWSQLCKKKNV